MYDIDSIYKNALIHNITSAGDHYIYAPDDLCLSCGDVRPKDGYIEFCYIYGVGKKHEQKIFVFFVVSDNGIKIRSWRKTLGNNWKEVALGIAEAYRQLVSFLSPYYREA